MSEFRWTDRYGAEHLLDTPQAINAEVEAVAAEIDRGFRALAVARPAKKDEVRDTLRRLFDRLQELHADSERWNASAFQQAKRQAEELAAEIETLKEEALPIVMVARLHKEHLEEFSSGSARPTLLAQPATATQMRAISMSPQSPKPSLSITRGEAREWLLNDPVFARPLNDEGGWFEWRDKDGGIHLLASQLQIELEMSSLIDELLALAPHLTNATSQYAASRAILAANEKLARTSVLQLNLEHFARQKEDLLWKICQSEWEIIRQTH